MLAKVTSKNQITIPKKIMDRIPGTQYFELQLNDDVITLRPLRTYETDLTGIRSKIKALGLKPESVKEAVEWARSK